MGGGLSLEGGVDGVCREQMGGAVPPLPNVPSWCAQGQLYLCIFMDYTYI